MVDQIAQQIVTIKVLGEPLTQLALSLSCYNTEQVIVPTGPYLSCLVPRCDMTVVVTEQIELVLPQQLGVIVATDVFRFQRTS